MYTNFSSNPRWPHLGIKVFHVTVRLKEGPGKGSKCFLYFFNHAGVSTCTVAGWNIPKVAFPEPRRARMGVRRRSILQTVQGSCRLGSLQGSCSSSRQPGQHWRPCKAAGIIGTCLLTQLVKVDVFNFSENGTRCKIKSMPSKSVT